MKNLILENVQRGFRDNQWPVLRVAFPDGVNDAQLTAIVHVYIDGCFHGILAMENKAFEELFKEGVSEITGPGTVPDDSWKWWKK